MTKRFSYSAWFWIVLGAFYFLFPLVATLLFSLKDKITGKCCSLGAYGTIFHDSQFWHTLRLSFELSLETILVSLVLFVPTIYWVHLKLPKLRPLISFMALVPFVVPPIILVVGLLDFYRSIPGYGRAPQWFYGTPWGFLVAAYVILAFPYVFFSLDAGFRSIDVHTLTEASLNLGASWWTTVTRVILPNIRVAAVSASLLTLLALVTLVLKVLLERRSAPTKRGGQA